MKKTRTSLRTGFLTTILICWLVPIFIVVTLAGVLLNKNYRQSVQQEIDSSAANALRLVQMRFEDAIDDSKAVSYDGTVRDAYRTWLQNGDSAGLYGTVSDYGAHKEATQDLLLFYSHKEGKLISLKEYVDAMAEGQEKIYFAPGENKERLSKLPQVETLTKRGYDVLLFTEDVDEFVPQTLMTYMEKPFCNVSTEDLGLQTEEEKKQAEEKAEEMKGLLTFVKETLGDRVKEVKLSSELGSHPVCMTPAEGMSFEMEKYMKRANPEFAFPVGRVLELNPEHEAVQAMQKAMTEDPEKAKDYAKLLCYQAQLMAELPLDDPYAYTELVCRLMK